VNELIAECLKDDARTVFLNQSTPPYCLAWVFTSSRFNQMFEWSKHTQDLRRLAVLVQQLPIPPRTGPFGEVEQDFECQYLQTEDAYLFKFKQSIDLKKTKANIGETETIECYMLMWDASG